MRKNGSVIANNRSAYYNYSVLDTFEAGLVLLGSEVKTMRNNNAQIKDAFVNIRQGEAWLKNMHVPHYGPANRQNHDPLRDKKLLLTGRQIRYLDGKLKAKDLTIAVLSLRFNKKGYIKAEIGLAKGKKTYDKRESIKKRDIERSIRRGEE